MRVFALSDVHVDYRANMDWVEALSEVDYRDDVLLLGGDISHRLDRFEAALRELARRFGLVFFVPGNHDLWLRGGEARDSLRKFHRLRAICEAQGVSLEPRRVGVDGRGDPLWIVPLHGWYEKPEEAETSLFVPKRGEDPSLGMWVDNWAVKWPDFGGGITPASYFCGMNELALREPLAGTVITFSHFLPRSELMFLTAHERASWAGPLVDPAPEFNFSRVAGTRRLDEQLRRAGSTLHVYGHQHRNRAMVLDGVRYVSHCLGYPRERALGRTRGVTSAPLKLVLPRAPSALAAKSTALSKPATASGQGAG
jgi:hypothetical protein